MQENKRPFVGFYRKEHTLLYTDNVGRKRWWLVYSLGFAALALAHAWPFLKSGTYFIWGADGYSQMYPVFCYFVSYAR